MSQKEKIYDAFNLTCVCGGNVETHRSDGVYSAFCDNCQHTASNAHGPEDLVVEWYGLVRERSCSRDIEDALAKILIFLSQHQEEVRSRKLVAIGGSGGQRALSILDEAGFISARYMVDQDGSMIELDIDKAFSAKNDGASVTAYCTPLFKPMETSDDRSGLPANEGHQCTISDNERDEQGGADSQTAV